MATTEADVKAEGARPERSASPAPAPAAAPAAKAKAKAAPAPRKGSPPLCDGFCYFLIALFCSVLLLGFGATAEADLWPGSLIRPYFWGPSPAITTKDWDEKTVGRTVFVKFYAPHCAHCKQLAPAWDKLFAENANHSFLRVGEVDCNRRGRALCQKFGVSAYPALKYGDPSNLQDYTGGRTFEELRVFASQLGPPCGPDHLEVCSEEEKNMVEEYQAMGAEKRQAKILEQEAEIENIEATFKAHADALINENKREALKHQEAVRAVMDGGLKMLKAVAAHEAALTKREDPTKDEKAEQGKKAEKAEL